MWIWEQLLTFHDQTPVWMLVFLYLQTWFAITYITLRLMKQKFGVFLYGFFIPIFGKWMGSFMFVFTMLFLWPMYIPLLALGYMLFKYKDKDSE